jgi:branched-chain amino acid transport system substrate-binding protein
MVRPRRSALGAVLRIASLALAFLLAQTAAAAPVLIGLDAEFGNKASTSAQAIRQGIEIAIDEINAAGGVLGGRKLELVVRDNGSIPAIGVDNLRELARMPDLVAVFGGRFSPVILEYVPVAHELAIPILDPWGSADPITDHRHRPSYTFRLSLRDAWAAPTFLRFAKETRKATRVGVMLPNTLWGRSNQAALARSAGPAGVAIVGERWFNLGDRSLVRGYRELLLAGAQAIILVSNEFEAATLVREIAALPAHERLPLIAHWGVTGGDFAALAGEALRAVDVAVIQTFSFIGENTPAARRVVAALKGRYGVASVERIRSPVGIAHAYDLTHLLAKAIDLAGTTDRRKVRDALERVGPYDGLVRRYEHPFANEAHEALSPAQAFMAQYTADDRLIPIDRRGR